MGKKCLAALLAVLMLVALTGCGEATDKPVSGTLTLDEYTQIFDVDVQQPEQGTDTLSLPVTLRLRNSEKLLSFIETLAQRTPTTYVNELKEYTADGILQDVTYTVVYDGMSATIQRDVNGEAGEPLELLGFKMIQLAQFCLSENGTVDGALFAQVMHTLGMDTWFMNYPYHMLYGVNTVVAVTVDGQYLIFDYYFDESVVPMLGGNIFG
ncbi:MAG: hypothetical protein E7553_03175 [Ruminococcaceae bacterium]|nr:hypothetical protein [Oscillospiraceae bacterium]